VPPATKEFTVRFAVPVFWMATFCDVELPTVTLPNESVPGVTAIAGVGAGWPAPVSATVDGEVGASLLIEIVPLLAPAAVGAYVTEMLAEAPAIKVAGMLIPLAVNPDPPATTD
jgi:hypothetical protein